MSRRTRPIKAFAPQPQRDFENEIVDRESTARKSVWTPPPSIQALISKVEHVEERLDHLETIVSQQADPKIRQQEQDEMDQSRQELEDMKRELNEAVQRLQMREAELQETQTALDNLTNQTAIDRDRIKALETEKKELHQLVNDLETKLNERVKKVGRLEKQVADMQRCLKNTNNQLEAMQQQMLQMQQQMNNIERGNATGAVGTSAATIQPAGTGLAPQGSPQQQWPGNVAQTPIVAEFPRPEPKPEASPRHHTGALGLPPIARPSGLQNSPGKNSALGNVKYNFPPK